MYKEANVIVLNTDKAENAIICTVDATDQWHHEPKHLTQSYLKDINRTAKHVYLTVKETPNIGDWVYSIRGFIGRFGKFENSYENECFKIIATTDKLPLKATCDCSETAAIDCGKPKAIGLCQQIVPQLPKLFLDTLCERYNKGNDITKVLVDFIGWEDKPTDLHHTMQEGEWGKYNVGKPKLANNYLADIKLIKDSWTREEIKVLFDRYNEFIAHNDIEKWADWITKNLQ